MKVFGCCSQDVEYMLQALDALGVKVEKVWRKTVHTRDILGNVYLSIYIYISIYLCIYLFAS